MTLVDALEASGATATQYEVTGYFDYHFVEDGNVFVVEKPGWLASIWSSPAKIYVAGPRTGEREDITSADAKEYRKNAEETWGRYIPGSRFQGPLFMPGTQRRTLPIFDEMGRQKGYVDEEGAHLYNSYGDGIFG